MRKTVLAFGIWLALAACASAATLLPNGKQQFISDTGAPLAGGSVTFYIPGSTIAKDTWQDAGQTILNTNPVILDSLGSALIFGTGSYRQVLRDVNGNVIWDQLTYDVSSAALTSQWAGTSAGTANAQTVNASNFTSVDGQTIIYRAGFTNTGALTLNPNGAGPIAVLKDTTSGALPLTAGDIAATNIVTVTYVSADGSFHTSAGADATFPTGMVMDYAGGSPPSGWIVCAGQAISRTAFSTLFAVIGVQYGAGDGSTTFNVPDLRGRVVAGMDVMGGSANANRLSFTVASTTLGAPGGAQTQVLITANLPAYTPSGSVGVNNWNDIFNSVTSSNLGVGPPLSSITYATTPTNTPNGTTATFTGNAQGGSSQQFSVTQPTMVMNKIIKF